jgi:copper chaperone NosL
MTKRLLALLLAINAVAGIVSAGCSALPSEVQPIAWNAETCGHCHMLIGDPAFAAQVITSDGEVLSFDDPACAARYIRSHRARIHRAWFHAGRSSEWIALADVGFVKVATSPMGSGVMAVPRATPGALTLEDL